MGKVRFREAAQPGLTLSIVRIERLSDGELIDFAGATGTGTAAVDVSACAFTSGTPAAPTLVVPETDPGVSGLYSLDLTNVSPAPFADGDYFALLTDPGNAYRIPIAFAIWQGDDATPLPIPAARGVVTGSPTGTSIAATMAGLGSAVAGSDLIGRRLYYCGGAHEGGMTAGCTGCTLSGSSATFTFAAPQPVPAAGDTVLLAGY